MAYSPISFILGSWGKGVDVAHATADTAATGFAVFGDIVTDVVSFVFNPFGIANVVANAVGGKIGTVLTGYAAVVDGIEEVVDTGIYGALAVADHATDGIAQFLNPNGIFTEYWG